MIWDSLLKPVTDIISDVIDKVVPDRNAAEKAKQDLAAQLQTAVLAAETAQIEVNKIEAASSSLFVAGWRPGIGWVCGFALAWQFVLSPMTAYLLAIVTSYTGHAFPALPVLDSSQLYPVLLGMLGLGGMRTFERVNGVARDSLADAAPKPSGK